LEGSSGYLEFPFWLDFRVILDRIVEVVAGVGADGFELALRHEGVGWERSFFAIGHGLLEVVLDVVGLAFKLASDFEFPLQPEGAVGRKLSLDVVVGVCAGTCEISSR